MTTQTQERQDQTVSTTTLPWGKLSQAERVKVRREIQRVCKSGGLNREHLAIRIADVLEIQADQHLDPLAVEAWDFNVRRSPGAWGDTFKNGHICVRHSVACDIVNWLLAKKFLLDKGPDGIVVCAEFPTRPASL